MKRARAELLADVLVHATSWHNLLAFLFQTEDDVLSKLAEEWQWNDKNGTSALVVQLKGSARGKTLAGLEATLVRALELQTAYTTVEFNECGLTAESLALVCAKVRSCPLSLSLCSSHPWQLPEHITCVRIADVKAPLNDAGCQALTTWLAARNTPVHRLELVEWAASREAFAQLLRVLDQRPRVLRELVMQENTALLEADGLGLLAGVLERNVCRLERLSLRGWYFSKLHGCDAVVGALKVNKWLTHVHLSRLSDLPGKELKRIERLKLHTTFQDCVLEDQDVEPGTALDLVRVVDLKRTCAFAECTRGACKTGRCGGSCGGWARYCSIVCQQEDWQGHHLRDGCKKTK